MLYANVAVGFIVSAAPEIVNLASGTGIVSKIVPVFETDLIKIFPVPILTDSLNVITMLLVKLTVDKPYAGL